MSWKILPVFIIALAFGASAGADNMMRVVVLGDSLTSGYQLQPDQAFPAKLQKKLEDIGFKNVRVINMSVAGETTGGGVERVNTVLAQKPDVVVVALGANDVRRGIDPVLINQNLGRILGRLGQHSLYVVLAGTKAPPSADPAYAKQIEDLYANLAKYYSVPFYPFILEGIYENPELNLADGYNPNAQGVDVMVEGIYRLVDTGLRWRWGVRQHELEQEQKMQPPPAPPRL